jgi:flagellar basal body-associated protein FliL
MIWIAIIAAVVVVVLLVIFGALVWVASYAESHFDEYDDIDNLP